MVYLITNNPDGFKRNPTYIIESPQVVVDYLKGVAEVSLDLETTGFDCHTSKITCLQVGDEVNQYVVDLASVPISLFKYLLENLTVLGQNLKFDLRFLYVNNIWVTKIYDTFVAEKILTCGLKIAKADLKTLVEAYCGETLNKEVRTDITKKKLSPSVIAYAADDVKYLFKIRKAQLEKASPEQQDLLKVIDLENLFTPALAYIEFSGFKLSKEKWEEKMAKDLQNYDRALAALNNWIFENNQTDHIDKQLDMFTPQVCTINWSSPKQTLQFFQKYGLDLSTKEYGKFSTEETVIGKYAKEHEIVAIYLEYKKYEKVVGTYGNSFINQINPITNRIHSQFKQIMSTGRISSGGKDMVTKKSTINLQNIPSDKETRACFVAEKGNTLIISDYAGQEQIVLANYCLDEALLKFYDEGLGDMHSYVAALIYPELQGLSLEEIKEKHRDKRGAAKSVGFSINYGGSGMTIAEDLGVSKEAGDKIYNAYLEAFIGLKDYFTICKNQGLKDGYVLISEITNRKSYFYHHSTYKQYDKLINKKYWEQYRKLRESGDPKFAEMRYEVKQYFKFKGEIERACLNFPIQGRSAEISKMACVYVFKWIIKNNYMGIIKFCNAVHDELVLECPLELSEETARVVKLAMVQAGKPYCKRVPLTAEPEQSDFWKK